VTPHVGAAPARHSRDPEIASRRARAHDIDVIRLRLKKKKVATASIDVIPLATRATKNFSAAPEKNS
jgi:hypothetical protein